MLLVREMRARRVSLGVSNDDRMIGADHMRFLFNTHSLSRTLPSHTSTLLSHAHTPGLRLTDNDNDVSDVGSLPSEHVSTVASTPSTAGSSPRMQMSHALHATPGTMGAPAIPPVTKRALNRGRVEELGGEGSQSEGLDSPT